MRKLYIVKTNKDFENIIINGTCLKNRYYIPNNLPYDRFGISVSKKLGNSVFRNNYKRKIRSIIDNYKKHYNNKEDYIIILRKEAINKPYDLLEKEMFSLLNEKKKGTNDEKE